MSAAPSQDTVVVFDVETTGTDRKRDQIIELCMQLGMNGEGGQKIWRFLPTVDMSPAAIERRLATVGALHRLMLSLLTAKPVPPTR